MKKLQNRKGFTLVELLIVMAIIGILVLIAVPRFAKTTEVSKVRTVQSNARTLGSAASLYIADKAGDIAAIQAGDTNSAADQGILVSGGYLSKALNNQPNGATYYFEKTPSGNLNVIGKIELKSGLATDVQASMASEGVVFSGTENKTVTVTIPVV